MNVTVTIIPFSIFTIIDYSKDVVREIEKENANIQIKALSSFRTLYTKEVVEKEQAKLDNYRLTLQQLQEQLNKIKELWSITTSYWLFRSYNYTLIYITYSYNYLRTFSMQVLFIMITVKHLNVEAWTKALFILYLEH